MDAAVERQPHLAVAVWRRQRAFLAAIGLAWLLAIWAEASGSAARLHHDALFHSTLPFWQAALLLLAAWQVMTAAMMLPSSLPMLRHLAALARPRPDRHRVLGLFVLAYFAVWSGFALAAFAGDYQVHRLYHAWGWLNARPQVIAAATLALAAGYQFTPLLDACLRRCRHPAAYLMRFYRAGPGNAFRLGLGHALFCLGCCWALMLVMFAAGVAHLWWMAVLGLVMLAEKVGRGGDRLARPVGAILAGLAVLALLLPGSVPGL